MPAAQRLEDHRCSEGEQQLASQPEVSRSANQLLQARQRLQQQPLLHPQEVVEPFLLVVPRPARPPRVQRHPQRNRCSVDLVSRPRQPRPPPSNRAARVPLPVERACLVPSPRETATRTPTVGPQRRHREEDCSVRNLLNQHPAPDCSVAPPQLLGVRRPLLRPPPMAVACSRSGTNPPLRLLLRLPLRLPERRSLRRHFSAIAELRVLHLQLHLRARLRRQQLPLAGLAYLAEEDFSVQSRPRPRRMMLAKLRSVRASPSPVELSLICTVCRRRR